METTVMTELVLDDIVVETESHPGVRLASEFSDMFSSRTGEEEAAVAAPGKWPDWLVEMDELYRANRSHVFILYGNVNDYPDNTGLRGDVNMVLFDRYDDYWLMSRTLADAKNKGEKPKLPSVAQPGKPRRLAAVYTVNRGLVFATDRSRTEFREFMKKCRPDIADDAFQMSGLESVLWLLEQYFQASAKVFLENFDIRSGRKNGTILPEISLTLVVQNPEFLFPAGDIGSLSGDRTALATLINWARDGSIASRNKIVLVTPSLSGVNPVVRSGENRISAVRVRRPNLEERREWLSNFVAHVEKNPVLIHGKKQDSVLLDPEINLDAVANATAGMNRQQMEGIFMDSWIHQTPVDIALISQHKQKATEAEFGDVVTIKQPQGSFDLVGGHDLLKEYLQNFILMPLLLGDRKQVVSGVLLSGPPGTGKTFLAECLAAVAKFNFVEADFSRLFGSLVGETEQKTEQFLAAIESLAPCIVFCDELDSVFSSGRQSPGDSGVQARMFNKVMKWLSSPARIGQVVVVAATNRPDLLDAAFIRAGRFDDILPCLPPGPGDAKGRAAILNALRRKLNLKLSRELGDTVRNPDAGLGRLLHDRRIWSGAEIERLLKLANSYAYLRMVKPLQEQMKSDRSKRRELMAEMRQASRNTIITAEDWEKAMDSYLPSSRDVELQIDLALRFCNNLNYCPPEWRPRLMELRQESSQDGAAYMTHSMLERE